VQNAHPVERLYQEFGLRVRSARKGAGLSQQKLAERVGLSRTSITNIERGRQQVALHMLYRLASAVGKNPSELLPDEAVPPEEEAIDATALRGLEQDQREWVQRVLGQASQRT
jgi:transcriptional regulator with XRE-family HTH domain